MINLLVYELRDDIDARFVETDNWINRLESTKANVPHWHDVSQIRGLEGSIVDITDLVPKITQSGLTLNGTRFQIEMNQSIPLLRFRVWWEFRRSWSGGTIHPDLSEPREIFSTSIIYIPPPSNEDAIWENNLVTLDVWVQAENMFNLTRSEYGFGTFIVDKHQIVIVTIENILEALTNSESFIQCVGDRLGDRLIAQQIALNLKDQGKI
jgi:hypothetical protein